MLKTPIVPASTHDCCGATLRTIRGTDASTESDRRKTTGRTFRNASEYAIVPLTGRLALKKARPGSIVRFIQASRAASFPEFVKSTTAGMTSDGVACVGTIVTKADVIRGARAMTVQDASFGGRKYPLEFV